jgi:IclR family acetate operon transcriptional repressor
MASTAARAPGNGITGGATGRSLEPDPLTVRALARGLSILSLFDVDHREWSIDEMAARAGLLRMTAYRMVRTLEAAGYLVRDAATNTYHVGPAAIALSYVAEGHSEFIEHARPFLEGLVAATSESVTLAVPVDGTPVCVSAIDSSRPFQRQLVRGRIIGDLASVHGKIFAAFSPPERRAELLARQHRRYTPHTITDPQALAEELDCIAHNDVAFDLEGLYLGACAVGAPVRDQLGAVVAAMSVVMPPGRFGPAERELCTREVKRTAAALSAYLGWNPPAATDAPRA